MNKEMQIQLKEYITKNVFSKIEDEKNYGYTNIYFPFNEHNFYFIHCIQEYLNNKGFKTYFKQIDENLNLFIYWDKLTKKYLNNEDIIINYSSPSKIMNSLLLNGILLDNKFILPNEFILRISRYGISDICIFSLLDKKNEYAILHPLYFDKDNNIQINFLDNIITIKYNKDNEELLKTIKFYNECQNSDDEQDKNIFDNLILINI